MKPTPVTLATLRRRLSERAREVWGADAHADVYGLAWNSWHCSAGGRTGDSVAIYRASSQRLALRAALAAVDALAEGGRRKSEVARLREALRPIVDAAKPPAKMLADDVRVDVSVTIADLRRAREAMGGGE